MSSTHTHARFSDLYLHLPSPLPYSTPQTPTHSPTTNLRSIPSFSHPAEDLRGCLISRLDFPLPLTYQLTFAPQVQEERKVQSFWQHSIKGAWQNLLENSLCDACAERGFPCNEMPSCRRSLSAGVRPTGCQRFTLPSDRLMIVICVYICHWRQHRRSFCVYLLTCVLSWLTGRRLHR